MCISAIADTATEWEEEGGPHPTMTFELVRILLAGCLGSFERRGLQATLIMPVASISVVCEVDEDRLQTDVSPV